MKLTTLQWYSMWSHHTGQVGVTNQHIYPKFIPSSNLAKICFLISATLIAESFWNFAQSTAVILLCSVPNIRRTLRLTQMLSMKEILWDLSARCILYVFVILSCSLGCNNAVSCSIGVAHSVLMNCMKSKSHHRSFHISGQWYSHAYHPNTNILKDQSRNIYNPFIKCLHKIYLILFLPSGLHCPWYCL